MVFALFLVKTPSDYYPKIWERIFALHGTILVLSLAMNMLLCIGWYFNSRRLRKKFELENQRIIDERNALQKKCGVNVESSIK